MDDPGTRLKQVREKLRLSMREVENHSREIALHRRSGEYILNISRLSEIENRSILPSVYRIYSLCAIYRLDYYEVLSWYGVALCDLPGDALKIPLEATAPVDFHNIGDGMINAPLTLDPGVDLRKTTFLSRVVSKWGRVSLAMLTSLETKRFRYALIGTQDRTMYPLLQPGALVLVDDSRRKIVNSGWTSEFERPIYLLEHRDGFACSWCTLQDSQLVLQPHPASLCPSEVFQFPQEIEVVGQVTGVAMLLGQESPRHTRS